MNLKRNQKLKHGEKQELFTEMHTLLNAGLDFTRMFEVLTNEVENPLPRAGFLKEIYISIVQGDSLYTAMLKSGAFSILDCSTIRIGENTGHLEYTLSFLAEYYRKKEEQRKAVISAVAYPLVVLCFAIVVLAFMMLVIIPMFSQVYYRMGQELPDLTRRVISLSERVPQIIIALLIISACLVMFLPFYKDSPSVMKLRSYITLRFPYIGKTVKLEMQGNFCRMMSLLSSTGVPMLDALELVSDSMQLHDYKSAFEDIRRNVKCGSSLSDSLSAFPALFGNKVCMMIRVGEESNRLSDMFTKAGNLLSESLDYHLKKLATYIEPVLILLVGAIVAVILISMYLPMFKMGMTMTS